VTTTTAGQTDTWRRDDVRQQSEVLAAIGPPRPPSHLLERPRLLDRLDRAPSRRITLVSGPRGYGKTTLAAQWCIERCPTPVTWLAATAPMGSDSAAASALSAIVAATAEGDNGSRVVVIDGLEGPEAGSVIVEAAHRLPPDVHLLMLSRPQLTASTAALRLEGELDHIDSTDLRLRPEELRALLRTRTGSEVTPLLAETLCDHLEGWMAGAVLLTTDWDPACTPSNHHTVLATGYEAIGEVLATTILDAAPVEARRILLRTSCLPEISGPLCDHVTGASGCEALLRAQRGAGTFLSVGQRTSSGHDLIRLHPLARAALADRRSAEDLEAEPAVLRSAVDWYATQRLPLLAAECLVRLEDWDELGDLLISNLPVLLARGALRDLARVLERLPTNRLLGDVLVAGSLASLYMATGRYRQALDLLGLLRNGAPPRLQLACDVSAASAYPFLEDPTAALASVERAMELADALGDDELFAHNALNTASVRHYRIIGRSAGLVAAALAGEWERAAALDVDVDPVAATEMLSFAMVQVHGRHAAYHALGGWLERAASDARSALAATVPGDLLADQNLIHTHLALAEVHRLRVMHADVEANLDACHQRAVPSNRHNCIAAVAASRASLHLDLNQPAAALDVIDTHRAATRHRPPPTVAGMLAAAEGLALDAVRSPQQARDVLDAAPRTSAVAAARVLVAVNQGMMTRANQTLAHWPDEPTPASAVRRSLAAALLGEVAGHRQDATHHLRAALRSAAPHGLLQPFIQVGTHLLRPLRAAAAGVGEDQQSDLARQAVDLLDSDTRTVARLSARERLVLQHLATGATLATIAEHLVVSVNTVKAHTKGIYRKLGVSSRAEAVAHWRPTTPP
jgi:LuxR family maltose regulon positive regulatory protein